MGRLLWAAIRDFAMGWVNCLGNRSMAPELIGKLQTFARNDHVYIVNDMHSNNIMIHSYLVADINKEKNTMQDCQTESSGNSDWQIMIV